MARSVEVYTHLSGEDLDECETSYELPSETTKLLHHTPRKGDAGLVKSFLTLFKAFIGTGIMFLPRAFRNGGMLFSVIIMIFISAISMLAFHLLLSCRTKYGGSFGDIGNAIVGPTMRIVILSSIALSQVGFVCAGIAFVAENFHQFSQATTYPMASDMFIVLQLVVLIPLALIRHMSKIGPAATVADVFIVAGLFFVVQCDLKTIALKGVSPTVTLFNPKHFTMTIGSAIFTFEGIGLIIPIQSSMEKPQYFEYLLGGVMVLITVIYIVIGALSYLAFGDDTKIEIMSNFPQNSLEVHAVQLMYPLAVLFGVPVQLFPIIKIFENMYFVGRPSGKFSPQTKWQKNGFRAALVVICGVISYAGMENLDMFVSLTGSVACIPLVYVYPPYLHLLGMAQTRAEKVGDVLFMTLGLVAMVYTTSVTLGWC